MYCVQLKSKHSVCMSWMNLIGIALHFWNSVHRLWTESILGPGRMFMLLATKFNSPTRSVQQIRPTKLQLGVEFYEHVNDGSRYCCIRLRRSVALQRKLTIVFGALYHVDDEALIIRPALCMVYDAAVWWVAEAEAGHHGWHLPPHEALPRNGYPGNEEATVFHSRSLWDFDDLVLRRFRSHLWPGTLNPKSGIYYIIHNSLGLWSVLSASMHMRSEPFTERLEPGPAQSFRLT